MSDGANPFDDTSNPFGDPAIENITRSTQRAENTLSDYNPFQNQNNRAIPPQPVYTQQPAVILTSQPKPAAQTNQPPPTYSPLSAQTIGIDALERQKVELDRKAAELDRKEQALRNAELGNTGGGPIKNFPPLPSWFPLKPCFYQDISVEIPMDFQRWVRILYYLWMFHGFTLFLNIIAALAVFIVVDTEGVSFALAIFYFILFTPCSYLCWFRPAYKAFRSDSSFNFMIFFFIFFCQFIVNVLEAVGIRGSGFCGLSLLVSVFSNSGAKHVAVGVLVLIVTASFLTVAAADILVLIKIHRLYRGTGASFEQAQREFATNVLSNKTVQNAATTVITESARATVQSYASGSNTTQPKY